MRILTIRLLRRAAAGLTRRLDAQDEDARSRAWTVTAGRFGARTYRDPRWDQVQLRAGHLSEDFETIPVTCATPISTGAPAAQPGAGRDARVLGRPAVTR
jgi:hypothetical protein